MKFSQYQLHRMSQTVGRENCEANATVFNGATVLLSGIRRRTDSLTDHQPQADASNPTMAISPCIVMNEFHELTSLMTVDVRVIKIINRRIVPEVPDPTEVALH